MEPNMTVRECLANYSNLGYQAIELAEAEKVVLKMKRSGAKNLFKLSLQTW